MLGNDALVGLAAVGLILLAFVAAYQAETGGRGQVNMVSLEAPFGPARIDVSWTYVERDGGLTPMPVTADDEPARYELHVTIEDAWPVTGDARYAAYFSEVEAERYLNAAYSSDERLVHVGNFSESSARTYELEYVTERDLRPYQTLLISVEYGSASGYNDFYVYVVGDLAAPSAPDRSVGPVMAPPGWVGYNMGHLFVASTTDGWDAEGTVVVRTAAGASYCLWALTAESPQLLAANHTTRLSGHLNWDIELSIDRSLGTFHEVQMWLGSDCANPEGPAGFLYSRASLPASS